MKSNYSRRNFLGLISAGATASTIYPLSPHILAPSDRDKPALLGGTPVRDQAFPAWPLVEENDRKAWQTVLDERTWNRGRCVEEFEAKWAKQLDCPFSVATSSGTAALYTSLYAMGVGPGDEVIVPPYTFVATINVVLLHYALPIFVDSERATFQIDAKKIEASITDRTRCIIPVHLGGNCADMDAILEIGKKHDIQSLEDACQAHLAEWRDQKVGTIGDLGCFSFQASKNLNCGEGGAITTRSGELAARCASFHNAGRAYAVNSDGRLTGDRSSGFAYTQNGDNRRLTEFQGTLLLEQLTRLEMQAKRREENAAHLTEQLNEIPGISPARMYEGCTRNAYHLYMFRYDPKGFSGMPRSRFIKALEAEGVPCSNGYGRLNEEPFLKKTLESERFRKVFSEKDITSWPERNECPENNRLCEEAVWFGQTQLLGPKSDMDQIADAVRKIQRYSAELAG